MAHKCECNCLIHHRDFMNDRKSASKLVINKDCHDCLLLLTGDVLMPPITLSYYQKMVVIFVDLLGTKNNVQFKDKYMIHRLFHGEARTNEERNLPYVIYDRKVYSFSDCAYFFYYYKDGVEDFRKNDMKLLQIAMSNTANSLLRILNAGYLLRGGIAIGDAYFDELGFFGPAVEEAYRIESGYADVPIIALNSDLGKEYCEWEESETDMGFVDMMMTSRPMLVEMNNDKHFLNVFYQFETFSPTLILEDDAINLNSIIDVLTGVISRDKEKYGAEITQFTVPKKSTIYEKLDWYDKYLLTKNNRLRSEIKAFSQITCGY